LIRHGQIRHAIAVDIPRRHRHRATADGHIAIDKGVIAGA
jgi:hypothetical protein